MLAVAPKIGRQRRHGNVQPKSDPTGILFYATHDIRSVAHCQHDHHPTHQVSECHLSRGSQPGRRSRIKHKNCASDDEFVKLEYGYQRSTQGEGRLEERRQKFEETTTPTAVSSESVWSAVDASF